MVVDIYLASQSPRRREILRQIGVRHAVVHAAVPEVPEPTESALDYVQRLAREKASAGFATLVQQSLPVAPVLGADTLGLLDGHILEKPRDKAHAAAMLRSLSGRTHQVITAVSLCSDTQQLVRVSTTHVTFRELNDAEIEAYWHTGEPQDKAGGYAIQGMGAVFVKEIHGSYSGVVGLPIETTCALLREFGVEWWQPVAELSASETIANEAMPS